MMKMKLFGINNSYILQQCYSPSAQRNLRLLKFIGLIAAEPTYSDIAFDTFLAVVELNFVNELYH